MSDSTTEQGGSGINQPTTTEDFIYVDDETGDSEFEPNEGSAGQDDESIAPDEDVPDDGEIDSLMRSTASCSNVLILELVSCFLNEFSDLLAAYGVPPSVIPTARSAVGAATSAPSVSTSTIDRRITRKRRHNGSAVTAESPSVLTSETTAVANNNNNGTVIPAGDAIEIDLTKESNEDEEVTSNEQQPSGALLIDEEGTTAAAYDELGQSESEEPMETEDDDEDDVLDEEEVVAGDDEEDADEDKHQQDVSLWCKAFATGESPAYNSEEDEDYQPNVEGTGDWRGDIRVGDDFQAVIPSAPLAPNKRTDSHLGSEAGLLWQPGHMSEAATECYERTYTESIAELPPNALFHLMRSGYDADEALSRLQNRSVQPHEIRRPIEEWTEEDCTNFEKGFAVYEKNFYKIQVHRIANANFPFFRLKLPHKTTKDLVLFYYFYKKTARYEELMRLTKGEKNKPSHPAITDFMDILMQQQYVAAAAAQGVPSTSANPVQEGERRAQSQPAPSPSGDAASSGSSQSVIAISSNDSGDEAHSQQGASSVSPSSSSAATANAAASSSTAL
ncbi:unnamed protein product [Hymenolepis diminuta]|uniref:ELM2 domain-containing protein n=1 Tax=Hymenolepis diminuta TaxID=6216 RepID=A0A158QCR1_HYMDI|nr:unnamed protein product [Hymenolepis diminuta]